MMEYTMEELVPIVRKLAEKHHGYESTSMTYEKAEQLMEEARKRGQDPMKFALHQQEILRYMEKNSDELVSFEDYEDLSPDEKLEIKVAKAMAELPR